MPINKGESGVFRIILGVTIIMKTRPKKWIMMQFFRLRASPFERYYPQHGLNALG
jgi:hypothetical protein